MLISRKLKRKIVVNFRKYKYLANYLYWLFVCFVLVLGIVVFASSINLGGLRLYSVLTGSMSPKIPSGSLILIKTSDTFKVGDVITFHPAAPTYATLRGPITHRIAEVNSNGGETTYITKGDHNPSSDTATVTPKQIIGKLVFAIPLLGFGASFAKTPYGFVLFIIIPAVLIIFSEIEKMRKEISSLSKRRAYR